MESESAPFCTLLYSALTCLECGDRWREIQASKWTWALTVVAQSGYAMFRIISKR